MRWSPKAAGLIAAALLACGPGDSTGRTSGGAVDDVGRPIRLTAPPARIVSLSPATTELLFTLGAGHRVVGRTRWCQDPPAARDVPSVGDGLAPNVEAILARRPDLVAFYRSAANAAAIERLESAGVATVTLALDRLADLVRVTRLLGRVLGDSLRADSLIEGLEVALAAPATARAGQAPRVLLLAWDNPPIVIGGGSFLSEIVSLAGGHNVFDELDRPSATVSIETIAARDPDVVLVAAGTETASLATRPEWRVVRAIRERRFAVVQGSEFEHPSFRASAAVRQLARVLEGWRR